MKDTAVWGAAPETELSSFSEPSTFLEQAERIASLEIFCRKYCSVDVGTAESAGPREFGTVMESRLPLWS